MRSRASMTSGLLRAGSKWGSPSQARRASSYFPCCARATHDGHAPMPEGRPRSKASTRVSESTRSGSARAMSTATAPPSECPNRCVRWTPRASRISRTACAGQCTPECSAPPGPKPGRFTTIVRCVDSMYRAWADHMRPSSAKPCRNVTAGPSPRSSKLIMGTPGQPSSRRRGYSSRRCIEASGHSSHPTHRRGGSSTRASQLDRAPWQRTEGPRPPSRYSR